MSPRATGPPRARPSDVIYGVVVVRVNVSVLLYVPVRSASVAPIACLNVTVDGVVGDRRDVAS